MRAPFRRDRTLPAFRPALHRAAAVFLNQPAVSHDKDALEVLECNGLAVPSPVLRVFDLLILCYQTGVLDEAECNKFRQALLKEKEFLPGAFKHHSFVDGLHAFCPRLLDASKAPVGAPASAGRSYTRQLVLSPTGS